MENFKFAVPLQIRFGDLDSQWHVNNARFLTFFEHARFQYLMELGLFDGQSFFDLGLIVADIHVAYLAPVKVTQKTEIGVKTTYIGHKSMKLESLMMNADTGEKLAACDTVMVGYDYHQSVSRMISADWRKVISEFEGVSFSRSG